MLNDYLDEAALLRAQSKAFALATVVRVEKPTSARPGAKAIVTADGVLRGWVGGSCAQPTVVREAKKALQDGQPRLVRICPPEHLSRIAQEGVVEVAMSCQSGGTLEVYLEPYLPKPNLVVIGHLPVAEALVVLGKSLGYSVTAICLENPSERFEFADRKLERLDFSQLHVGEQAYVVVASHGNYDEEALEAVMKTEAAYVALVASKKRGQEVAQYLQEKGLAVSQLKRLKYPAGLDLGATTPEEIALSILAEIIQFRRSRREASVQVERVEQEEAGQAIDPICGMTVEIATARYKSERAGKMYYFCCAGCQRTFEKGQESGVLNSPVVQLQRA